ncbi:MAG: FliB family protein [Firmicutes bacterium HGW-Firmicutes-1]|jgi:lysine-N-methylase|nr:MAG: FliB family protein [Firmicutes bacterium HGW-Firmicutes-1]
MTKIIKLVYPTYLKQFQCIGGTCEDSCCIGWDVDIDRLTFRQYFRTKDSTMREIFKTYVYKNEDSYSEVVDYGKVRLGVSMRCPFLDPDHYCKIYRTLGESYLSNVCTSYPRVTNAVDDFYEVSLYISCPEAAKLILLNPDGIHFQESMQPLDKHVIGSIVDTRLKEHQQSPIKYFKEIREKCIQLIQNRKYSLTHRLLILGTFLENMEEKSEISQKSMISYLKTFNPDSYPNLDNNTTNLPLLIRLFKNWIENLHALTKIDSVKFVAYTKIVQDSFMLSNSSNIIEQASQYEESMIQFLNPFIQEHAYIFENDLVNLMFKNMFPFSQTHCMFDGYIMLIIHFLLTRFYLAAVFKHNKKASSEDAVLLIQVLAKTIDHNTFLDDLFHEIKVKEYDNMEFVKALL